MTLFSSWSLPDNSNSLKCSSIVKTLKTYNRQTFAPDIWRHATSTTCMVYLESTFCIVGWCLLDVRWKWLTFDMVQNSTPLSLTWEDVPPRFKCTALVSSFDSLDWHLQDKGFAGVFFILTGAIITLYLIPNQATHCETCVIINN